ncbi:MAG: hypothetical protein ACT4PO_07690 [Actinomycetota bacterium]
MIADVFYALFLVATGAVCIYLIRAALHADANPRRAAQHLVEELERFLHRKKEEP